MRGLGADRAMELGAGGWQAGNVGQAAGHMAVEEIARRRAECDDAAAGRDEGGDLRDERPPHY